MNYIIKIIHQIHKYQPGGEKVKSFTLKESVCWIPLFRMNLFDKEAVRSHLFTRSLCVSAQSIWQQTGHSTYRWQREDDTRAGGCKVLEAMCLKVWCGLMSQTVYMLGAYIIYIYKYMSTYVRSALTSALYMTSDFIQCHCRWYKYTAAKHDKNYKF